MGDLFGSKPDTSKQEAKLAAQEKQQAAELAARRRAAAGSNKSKTLFSTVLGTDEAIGKQTKLGG